MNCVSNFVRLHHFRIATVKKKKIIYSFLNAQKRSLFKVDFFYNLCNVA